jgi:hypothetical protein
MLRELGGMIWIQIASAIVLLRLIIWVSTFADYAAGDRIFQFNSVDNFEMEASRASANCACSTHLIVRQTWRREPVG